MDDIRKVPDALIRGSNGNRSTLERGESGQWRRCPCERPDRPLPFYMTYPMPMTWEEEDAAARDLYYLLQMYPRQARKYREKISIMLDTMDYEGSMIYDEYPDRLALMRLSENIWREIRRQEESEQEKTAGEGGRESEAYWDRIRELLEILLYYEIYRRRRGTPPVMNRRFWGTVPSAPTPTPPWQGNRGREPYDGLPDPCGARTKGGGFGPAGLP